MRFGPIIGLLLFQTSFAAPGAEAQSRDTSVVIRPDSRAPVVQRAQGGVRIQSFRGRRIQRSAVQQAYPAAGVSPGITQADLVRLENRIMARLGALLAGIQSEESPSHYFPSAGPGSYFVFFPPDGEGVPDTVFIHPGPDDPLPPATRLDPPRISDTSLLESPRAEIAPLVAQIEREIFDRGLFSAISVQFEFGSSRIMGGSAPVLEAVSEVLRRHPDLRIIIEGHTDNVGGRSVNQRLSLQRAQSVKEFLVSNDPEIDPDRLEAMGKGMDEPVASNDTESGRALNRRVVFRVDAPVDAARGIPPEYRSPRRVAVRPASFIAPGDF